jgi:hypothetical protein
MGLPINMKSLVHGNTIECERLEFKQCWNPEDVMHFMCAFANDFHNLGVVILLLAWLKMTDSQLHFQQDYDKSTRCI